MTDTVKVTSQGILVPRPLIESWGDIQEVEIERRPDAIIIKPKGQQSGQFHEQIIEGMKAAGLIEDLPWPRPPLVSARERARLAKALSQGKPLSAIILEDREDYA